MISLSGLNSEQAMAAEITEGPLLILAGAGSGKTRTVTYRIAHMIDNLGIPGKSILAVSFTNKAAKEMQERVITLLGKRRARGTTLSTFHSLGVKILKQEITHLGYGKNFTIYDSSDQVSIVRQILKNFKDKKAFDRKKIMSKIGMLKNKGIREDDFAHSEFYDPEDPYDFVTEHVYHEYQDRLKFYNAIDFDDILFLVVRLFRENPEIAKKYSEKYQYIMIDEYQDTNPLQFEMIKGLTSMHNNICVVGDDDQSIYSFRGADISNILNFEKHYPGARVIKLEQNYRSTPQILKLANKVISENKNRKDKKMWTQGELKNPPYLWAMGDTDHEAAVIADEINKLQNDGHFLADIAILVRGTPQIPPLEEALRIALIPYKIIGGQKFYEKKEVKDLIAYLSLIHNNHDELALRRILNVPNRGIGTKTLEKFLEVSKQKEVELFEVFKNHCEEISITNDTKAHIYEFTELIESMKGLFEKHSLAEATQLLIEKINYVPYIEKQYDSATQVEQKRNDLTQFVESAKRFEKYNPRGANLGQFLEKVLLVDNSDNGDEDDDIRPNKVIIMTLHASKGLEFDTVFLIGVEEEILPHKKTIQLNQDMSEERRLAYVGITRAKEQLFMTYCKERKLYGRQVPRHKSRFISELGDDFFKEQDRTTFGHMSEEEAQEYKKDFFSGLSSLLE